MDFGYTGPLEVRDQDLITIGRFVHRCGLFEHAIDGRLERFGLSNEIAAKCRSKPFVTLACKLKILNEYCESYEIPAEETAEYQRILLIRAAITKYRRQNGVKDLRDAIAHNPIIVSVMGAWQPGPGYAKKHFPKVRTSSGEEVSVFATWTFVEIEALSNELMSIIRDIGFMPKESV